MKVDRGTKNAAYTQLQAKSILYSTDSIYGQNENYCNKWIFFFQAILYCYRNVVLKLDMKAIRGYDELYLSIRCTSCCICIWGYTCPLRERFLSTMVWSQKDWFLSLAFLSTTWSRGRFSPYVYYMPNLLSLFITPTPKKLFRSCFQLESQEEMHNTKALRTIALALGLQFWFLRAVHQRCVLNQMKKGNSMRAGHLDIMLSFFLRYNQCRWRNALDALEPWARRQQSVLEHHPIWNSY